MKTKIWIAPVVLSTAMLFSACKDSSKPPEGNVATSETLPGNAKMSNADLEKAIRSKFESDSEISQAKLSIDAKADENQATIKGEVRSQDMRSKAIELAKSVQPGLTVNDEIEVRPAG